MEYRKDIDGLRALAIIPVMLYHAKPEILPGGFVGVDIFFVISGFLITRILLKEIEDEVFTLGRFYERRLRRLVPALIYTIIITLICSLFLLQPEDFENLAVSALASIFFVSNIYFYESTDYFSIASEFKPLLHTWSLAVEEQFYLIWPLVIIFVVWLKKNRKHYLGYSLVVLLILCSLILSTATLYKDQQASFYIIPFRLWELALGGLIGMILSRRRFINCSVLISSGMSLLGVGLILTSMTCLDSSSTFPGVYALPTAIGTALLIFYGSMTGNFIAKAFETRVLVFIGALSYSLYLVHWPSLALYRYYNQEVNIELLNVFYLYLAVLILSITSYYYVEKPFRRKLSKGVVYFSTAASVLMLSSVLYISIVYEGIPSRSGGIPKYAISKEVMWEWNCSLEHINKLEGKYCVIGKPWREAGSKIVLWGDSHAEHFAPLIEHSIKNQDISVLLYRGCPPFLDNKVVKRRVNGSSSYSDKCGKKFRLLTEWLAMSGEVKGLILAAAWSGYNDIYAVNFQGKNRALGAELVGVGLENAITQLPKQMKIWILSDVPRPNKSLLHCLANQSGIVLSKITEGCKGLRSDDMYDWHRLTISELRDTASKFANVQYREMLPQLCGPTFCEIYVKNTLIYQDGNHIRRNFKDDEKEAMVQKLDLTSLFKSL